MFGQCITGQDWKEVHRQARRDASRPKPTGAEWAPSSSGRSGELSFELKAEQAEGRGVEIELKTNLPDGAKVNLTVSRRFWEKGNSSAYSGEFFSENLVVRGGTVRATVTVDDAKWQKEREGKRAVLQAAGAWAEIGRVADTVEVDALFTPLGDQPRHVLDAVGQRGEKIKGDSAERSSNLTVCRVSKELRVPFQRSAPGVRTVSWLHLVAGRRYRIFADFPVMPVHIDDLEEESVDETLRKGLSRRLIKKEKTGLYVRVLQVRMPRVGNSPWYYIQYGPRKGWVNSTALIGKRIVEVR